MFSLVELEGFVAVAEEGGFRRAAQRLQMTQPPLSRQVRKLERALGVQLLERTRAGVHLTPAGRAFLAEAKAILGRVAAVDEVVRSASTGNTGTLAIGFTAVSALNVLRHWLQVAARRMPGVDLTLREGVTRHQIELLLAGELDVGLARGVVADEVLDVREVFAESFVLAAATGHPLTMLGRPPTLAEVARQPVVSYSPVSARYLHDRVIEAFIALDLTPRFLQFVTQVTTAMVVAASGVGVALVPASAGELHPGGVVAIPVADVPEGSIRTTAVWRRDNDNPALHRLLREVLSPPAG